MPCGATQDRQVMEERSDRMWSAGGGKQTPSVFCLENPMTSMKRQKDRTLKEELPRSVAAQYATGDQWTDNSRKNGGMEPKHHRLDGLEFEWTPGDGDGQGGLSCCNSWGRKESDTTERLNLTELNWYIFIYIWRRQWQPTPVFFPGEFHGQRSLVGCCPWIRTELDTTEVT